MSFTFYSCPDQPRPYEKHILKAFQTGCKVRKIPFRERSMDDWDRNPRVTSADAAVFISSRPRARPIYEGYRAAGKHTVTIDKGYVRIRLERKQGVLYWRVAVDGMQPLTYFQRKVFSDERWAAFGLKIEPCALRDGHILFAGGAQRICDFLQMGDHVAYAKGVMDRLTELTSRLIVYRPKPSCPLRCPIPPYRYSTASKTMAEELKGAHCLVTHSSNACFEAALAGVPTIVLGQGITRSISRTQCDSINTLRTPTWDQVHALACAVAHCQWTLAEMSQGLMLLELEDVFSYLSSLGPATPSA